MFVLFDNKLENNIHGASDAFFAIPMKIINIDKYNDNLLLDLIERGYHPTHTI